MTDTPRLFANLGAEEPERWLRMAAHPRVRSVARLWAALFPADARLAGPARLDPPRLAGALARTADEPALEVCAARGALVPWLATREAEELARREGVPLAGVAPEIVRRVHDKAFAQQSALEAGLVPASLGAAALRLEPEDLTAPDAVRCRVEAAVAGWPPELRARFTLKPRIGTSGRGRCEGRDGKLDPARLARSLAPLRAAGGALVEPWLERTLDLSAQLHVAGPDDVRVLGTLRQVLTAHGGPVGHAGRIAGHGRIDSGTPWDAELRKAADVIGRAAAREGFRGACGLDAFVFRASDGSERLRPVVELNARFTAGTIALGHLARAQRAALAEGARAFYFGFAPSGSWSEQAAAALRVIAPLADDPSARLCLADDASALSASLELPRAPG